MPGSNIKYSTGEFLYDSSELPASQQSISTQQSVAAKPSLAPMKLKTDGLDFNNVKAVQWWLKNNGANITVDNMYGKNTNAAIDQVLKNMALTSTEKQKFIDLQNRMKGKWIGQKQLTPKISQQVDNPVDNPVEINTPNLVESTKGKTFGTRIPSISNLEWESEKNQKITQPNSVQATTSRYNMQNTATNGDFGIGRAIEGGLKSFINWVDKSVSSNPNNRNRSINKFGYYQQGGAMANQEELQKAFMAYLIQDAAAQGIQLQSEQDLEQYAQQLGKDGIKAKYQEFMQKMQGGVMARLGAKLEYYKKLKGVCPEGEELVYFKQGGRICKACQKAQKGTRVKDNEVDKFKKGRAQYKKDMKSAKDEASRDSISINKYNDQETMSNKGHKGNFQKGKWVPDRKQYTKKDACGSKMKVGKCGSKMKK